MGKGCQQPPVGKGCQQPPGGAEVFVPACSEASPGLAARWFGSVLLARFVRAHVLWQS